MIDVSPLFRSRIGNSMKGSVNPVVEVFRQKMDELVKHICSELRAGASSDSQSVVCLYCGTVQRPDIVGAGRHCSLRTLGYYQ